MKPPASLFLFMIYFLGIKPCQTVTRDLVDNSFNIRV